MSWWKPDEQGKTDEQKKADEQGKTEADAIVEKFSAALDLRLKPLEEKVNNVATEWNQLKEASNKQPENNGERVRLTGVVDDQTEEAWKRDNIGPVLAETIKLRAQMTENEVLEDVRASSWADLVPDIRALLATIPIQQKADPNYAVIVRNAVKVVIGDKAMNSNMRFDGKTKTLFIDDSNRGVTGERSGQMSDADVAMLKKIGVGDIEKFSKAIQ